MRIAHYPGTVLEVVVQDDHQGDSSSSGFQSIESHVAVDDLLATGASREVARDVASLRIHDVDNNRALVVRSQVHPPAIVVQQLPNTSPDQYQQGGTGNNATLQQQIEGILGKMQQTDQQIQHTQQQMQDQNDKILQTLQQKDRQHTEETQRVTHEMNLHKQQLEMALYASQQQQQMQFEAFRQKIQQLDEQLLQLIYEKGNARQGQDHVGRQETQVAFNQFVHARYRVQAVFATSSPKPPIPRLFILLPAPGAVVDGQEESRQPQFRLYFLCECGSYTMDKDCDKQHEVHLANHPGYDLINQDELINKYGSYLLTMMYMVKYGAKTRDLMVPPLLGLAHAIGEHKNIGQLVDDTILRLKEATGHLDGDYTEQQGLNATELTGLQSHLKVTDGGCFTGGLSQRCIQKGHYAWICSDHWRESYELALQQLKYNIIANGGVLKGSESKVNVTSEAMARTFYHDLGKLFRTQSVKNWRSLTEVDYGHDSHQSVPAPMTKVFDDSDDLKSLFLDFGRFTMSVKGISEVKVKDLVISIEGLSTLTLDELEFIQQCRPTALEISQTPQKKDDNCIVSLLQHNVTTLRIGCDVKRYIAVIERVCSTREKMLRSGYSPALRTFELVHPEINVKICFDEKSPVLDKAPCIILGNRQSYTIEPAVYNAIRQHGWSVTTFVVSGSFSDRLAMLLDESMQETESRIVRLIITPTSLTSPGLDAMDRVINRSKGLTYLGLSLEKLDEGNQLGKALLLLGRHKDRLTSLRLLGWSVEQWLPRIAQTFPDKDGFPVLEEFFVGNLWTNFMSDIERQWIVSKVSTRPQRRTLLKVFGITDGPTNGRYYLHDWKPVILAIDISTVERLHFKTPSFCQDDLRLLADRIANSGKSLLPLRVFDLEGTSTSDNDITRGILARIREKTPRVVVQWGNSAKV